MRPKLPKTKTSKSITLNDETIKNATRLGNGNLSAGIELLYQFYKQKKLEEKETKRSDSKHEDAHQDH